MNLVSFLIFNLVSSISSKESLRFQYSQEQGYDNSCGMSVSSTVLENYWNIPTNELELVEQSLGAKLLEGNYTVNFSDMASIFTIREIASKAYKMDWNGLISIIDKGFAPVIVHYEKPEKHFALLLGFNDGRGITVDPARGLESISKSEFMKRFSGNVLVLASRTAVKNVEMLNKAIKYASDKQARMEEVAYMNGRNW